MTWDFRICLRTSHLGFSFCPVLYQQRAASTIETTNKTRHRNNFFTSRKAIFLIHSRSKTYTWKYFCAKPETTNSKLITVNFPNKILPQTGSQTQQIAGEEFTNEDF